MRVFLTGGTGFIGGRVAAKLRERGDDVVALARSPDRASALTAAGCELIAGEIGDRAALAKAMSGCDAAVHGAAIYEIGIPESERRRMYDTNVGGTENALRAALEAEVPKVVYVSTVAVFGNTRGQVVDESYEPPGREFTSYYEQTKYEAHRVAKRLIAEEGLPCVIVQPGGVYGPHDHSSIGQLMNQFVAGRLPALSFPDTGFNMVYVDDAAAGILLALDKGQVGESYVFGGQITTMRELFDHLARVTGRRPPRLTIPTTLIKAMTPIGPLVGKVMGQPPNLRELVSASDGVTYWAKHDKAIAELGYSSRGLEQGLRDMLAAEGKLPAAA